MDLTHLKIGARGSNLSLIQTETVRRLLQSLLPQALFEVVIIKTAGDQNQNPIPLDTVGKGWFTREIDNQLLEGKIDIAVHSLKDVLDTLTPGLTIAAIPEREDPREALITRTGLTLRTLPPAAVVGTDSIRRKVQILNIRPDLQVRSIRGNVDGRLKKLESGEYDGIFLAVAGLKRLGLETHIAEYFDPTDFVPSPGQGALAVVCRETDTVLVQILSQISHETSQSVVTAERAFSRAMGGGCSMPVGAYAQVEGEKLTLTGLIGSTDATHLAKDYVSGDRHNPEQIAHSLSDKLLAKSHDWYTAHHHPLSKCSL